eukprot:scaffold4777_cov120-Skeletonema_dohrnii-CCMP3373.AAC.13
MGIISRPHPGAERPNSFMASHSQKAFVYCLSASLPQQMNLKKVTEPQYIMVGGHVGTTYSRRGKQNHK